MSQNCVGPPFKYHHHCRSDFASWQDQSSVPLSSSPTAPPSTTTLVVAPISVVDHYLPYEKHNLYDITFNNTVLCDHHHRVLTVVDVLRDTKQKRHPDG
ncbi:hypothetical protein JHK82_039813 [Glycine max]|nr:hypothetical protein JHK86_040011 [Glycine max]KAG4965610.1 hypothetical protein JHK85_040585 [Glycine max]KAG5110590.1 hypothetical protein JHK82_039813 [Glycine max]KAG5121880.1 hypothetical protein JHK84_040220 [Glycine max]